jgi:hypothetical protein
MTAVIDFDDRCPASLTGSSGSGTVRRFAAMNGCSAAIADVVFGAT